MDFMINCWKNPQKVIEPVMLLAICEEGSGGYKNVPKSIPLQGRDKHIVTSWHWRRGAKGKKQFLMISSYLYNHKSRILFPANQKKLNVDWKAIKTLLLELNIIGSLLLVVWNNSVLKDMRIKNLILLQLFFLMKFTSATHLT